MSVVIIEPGFFTTALTSAERNAALLERRWAELPAAVRDEYGEHWLRFCKRPRLLAC